MPRIPSEFVPGAALQDGALPPVQAPGEVVPMRSYAGEQQAEMGNVMRNTGNVVWRIGQIVQDEMNEARVKASDVEFTNMANDLLEGKEGYLNTRGLTADRTFVDYETALKERANGILDSLDNDAQRNVFRQLAARTISQANSQMAKHRNTELRTYLVNETAARIDSKADAAVRAFDLHRFGPDYVQNIGAVNESVDQLASMRGIPLNSDQGIALRQSAMMRVVQGVTRKLADRNDYESALEYLDQVVSHSKSPDDKERKLGLKESEVAEIRSALMARRTPQMIKELVTSAYKTGQPNTPSGTHNMVAPVDNGEATISDDGLSVSYKVSDNMPVRAPTDVTVESINEAEGRVILVDKSGYTFTMVGVTARHADGTPMKLGDKVQKGKMIGFASADSDEPGSATFTYQASFAGTPRNPLTVNWLTPAEGPVTGKPPTKLSDLLSIIDNAGLSPENVASAKQFARQLWAQGDAEMEIKRAEVTYGLKIAAAEVDAANRALPVDQQDKRVVINEAWLREQAGADSPYVDAKMIDEVLETTETSAQARVMFASGRMTKSALRALRGAISNEDFRTYDAAVNDPKYQKVTVPQGLLDVMLHKADLGHLVNPTKGTTDEKRAMFLREGLNNWLAQKQVEFGRELERKEELPQAIAEYLNYQVERTRSFLSFDYLMPDWTGPRGAVLPDEESSVRAKFGKGTFYDIDRADKLTATLNSLGYPISEGNVVALDGIITDLANIDTNKDGSATGIQKPTEQDINMILSVIQMRGRPLEQAEARAVWSEILSIRNRTIGRAYR
jgi:hypothetical protein